ATLSVIDASAGGAFGSGPTLMNASFVTPPALAAMRTVVPRMTGLDVIVKLLALFPGAMETLGGTWTTDGLSLVNVTEPPPAGASMTRETVPRVDAPPIRPPARLTASGRPSARSVGVPGVGVGSISSSLA